jgi:uncharacterized repeat protein (TIGR03803 family)
MKPKFVPTGILALISSPPAAWLLAVALAVPAAQASVRYQTLRSFGGAFPDAGSNPQALIQGSDGVLYGTTGGGAFGRGTLFKVNKDGTGHLVLHIFGSSASDGVGPGALVQGSDGALYGTTYGGGTYTNAYGGTVFRLNTDGSRYQVLYNFGSTTNDGSSSFGLVEGSDGALYGMTGFGGEGAYTNWFGASGTVFKIAKDGSGYRVLYSFGSTPNDGLGPTGRLIEGSDGELYGTTDYGGSFTDQNGYSLGTVFKLNKDGSGYSLLHSFGEGSDGQNPNGLVAGTDGELYGSTYYGGTYTNQYWSLGTVFKLNQDGSGYRVLYNFGSSAGDGISPLASPVEGSDGTLYGTTVAGGAYTNSGYGDGTVFKINKDGSGYKLLYNFGTTTNDGAGPNGLIVGNDAALYGTTDGGGTPTNQFGSGGTVFELNKDGSGEVVLHSFWSGSPDGNMPEGRLLEGSDGALYGTTAGGGPAGGGTVFKLNKDASGYSLLHSFAHYEQYPYGALIQGTNGALYGTTQGARDVGAVVSGAAVFKLDQDGGDYTVLHGFPKVGAGVSAGLVKGTDSWLYGIDSDGVFKLSEDGSGYTTVLSSFDLWSSWGSDSPFLEGSDGALYGISPNHAVLPMVFKVDTSGGGYTVLHSFGQGGHILGGTLIEGSDGVLYGTTLGGGTHTDQWGNGGGTVFKLNKDGSNYSVLYNFGSTASDGAGPYARLLEGRDGVLYGTTQGGGHTNQYGTSLGTVFRLNKDGSGYAVLYNFGSTPNDGSWPQAGLMQGSDGAFYGTTASGGFYSNGTLFKLWPPETPDLLGFTTTTNTVQMSFAGLSGYHYRVLRSTDLATWSVLTTITMPPSGVYTNVDNSPPASAAYYRTAWVP